MFFKTGHPYVEMPVISIIIPLYNEGEMLSKNSFYFGNLSSGPSEVIFVDGRSTDDSADIAQKYGKVLHSEKNRAVQMNKGARSALGDILFFLHADTKIDKTTLFFIEKMIKKEGFIGGCLTQRIDEAGAAFRIIEQFGNIRARIARVYYGDQGIFVRKDIFLNLGGFPETPLMEDILFTRILRKRGKTIILPDKIFVSARRWKKNGVIRTILFYSLLNTLFHIRIPLMKIKPLYDDLR